MRNKNRPFSGARLLTAIWPSDADVTVDNVRVLVANLRQKLALADRKDFVKTVHNSGYVVEDASV
jgi:DNA-binding response OmpR family regulator